ATAGQDREAEVGQLTCIDCASGGVRRAMRPRHPLREAADLPLQSWWTDHAGVGTKPEDPADQLGAESHPQPHWHAPLTHERLLRTGAGVAADERRPPWRQAHLDLLDGIFVVDDDAEAVGEDAFR